MQKLMLSISNKGMHNYAIDIKHYVGTLKHFIHLRYLPLVLEQKIANKKEDAKTKDYFTRLRKFVKHLEDGIKDFDHNSPTMQTVLGDTSLKVTHYNVDKNGGRSYIVLLTDDSANDVLAYTFYSLNGSNPHKPYIIDSGSLPLDGSEKYIRGLYYKLQNENSPFVRNEIRKNIAGQNGVDCEILLLQSIKDRIQDEYRQEYGVNLKNVQLERSCTNSSGKLASSIFSENYKEENNTNKMADVISKRISEVRNGIMDI